MKGRSFLHHCSSSPSWGHGLELGSVKFQQFSFMRRTASTSRIPTKLIRQQTLIVIRLPFKVTTTTFEEALMRPSTVNQSGKVKKQMWLVPLQQTNKANHLWIFKPDLLLEWMWYDNLADCRFDFAGRTDDNNLKVKHRVWLNAYAFTAVNHF